MEKKAFQDYYPEEFSHCYGCGTQNDHGLKIKSHWDGDETVCLYMPKSYHTAIPGFVYGGLIASLIDCHSTGTAAAAAYRAENREPDTLPAIRFLTGSLHVDYLNPTPAGVLLEIRGKIKEIKGRKVTVTSTVSAEGVTCAKGEVVAIQVPERYIADLKKMSK